MKRLKNVALWIFVVLIFGCFTPAVHFVGRQSMFEIADGLAVGLGIGALIRWGPAAWNALRPPVHELRAHDFLIVGLGLICAGSALRFGSQWYWRASEKPDWFIDSGFLLYCTLAVAIGFSLTLVPTFSSEHGFLTIDAPRKTALLAAISLAISLLIIWAGWG